jgi:hypothetical protein
MKSKVIFSLLLVVVITSVIYLIRPRKYVKPIIREINRPFSKPLKKEPKALPNQTFADQFRKLGWN